jgi:CheY-like chemotaxis protein
MTAESTPGCGSVFTVRLPVLKEGETLATPSGEQDAAGLAPEETAPCTGTGKPVALVIDDDPNARDLLVRCLHKHGFCAETAGDGPSGLARARERRPDVITLDVIMPRMDGWAVLSALKGDATLADVPVVMVTVDGNRDLGFALGADEYLTKPLDRTRLSAILQRLCPRSESSPVMVVDDDPAARDLLRRILENEGFRVVEAGNGREALELLGRTHPSLLLLDLLMPVMDGFEEAAALRSHTEWNDIPVVVITAKDLTVQDHKRLNGSVRRILKKGAYTRNDLLAEVRRLVTARVDGARPDDLFAGAASEAAVEAGAEAPTATSDMP